MAKITWGPGWYLRTDEEDRPLTTPPRLPLGGKARKDLVRALEERSKADPRDLFEQRVQWRRWWVSLRFGEVGGRIECIGLEVMGNPDLSGQAPLTTLALRGLPFGKFVDRARGEYREAVAAAAGATAKAAAWNPALGAAEREEMARRLRADLGDRLALANRDAAANRVGRPRLYGPEHFARVAEVYTAEWRGGGHPTAEVARLFGTSRSAAAKWVARARTMGLLPQTVKGKGRGISVPPQQGRAPSSRRPRS